MMCWKETTHFDAHFSLVFSQFEGMHTDPSVFLSLSLSICLPLIPSILCLSLLGSMFPLVHIIFSMAYDGLLFSFLAIGSTTVSGLLSGKLEGEEDPPEC